MGAGNKDKMLEDGKQTDDDVQVLAKQTADLSPSGDIIDLDTTKKFRDPVTNEILTYEEIKARTNRGKLFDKTQSELQKEQASRQKAEENLAEANLRATLAEQRADQALLNQRIARIENPDDDLDTYDGTTQDNQIVDRTYRQKIQPEFDKVTSELTELRKRQADFEQREKEQANREAFKQAREIASQAKMYVLQNDFPDISEKRLAEIARQEDLAAQAQLQGLDAAQRYGILSEEYQENMSSSNLYISTASKLRAKAVIDQEKETARKERQNLVETGSQTRPSFTEEKYNPSNRSEVQKRDEAILENARKRAEARSKAKETL